MSPSMEPASAAAREKPGAERSREQDESARDDLGSFLDKAIQRRAEQVRRVYRMLLVRLFGPAA